MDAKLWMKELALGLTGARWGFDSDGCFGLRLLGWNFIFYKWSEPLITKDDGTFVPLADWNSKPVYRHLRKYEDFASYRIDEIHEAALKGNLRYYR